MVATESLTRVLLVEDNPDHAELVLAAMADVSPGTTVAHVADGEAAIRFLQRFAAEGGTGGDDERPGLVLLDLRLPKADGIEVLQRVKSDASLRAIPVVVLTTSDSSRDVVLAYQNHANSYIVKPFGMDALQATMGQVLSYWSSCNHQPC